MWDVLCRNAGLFQEFKRLESDDETGIITLESPLDTAIRVLEYRLSLTTDNTARTIYTYRISLLKEKVLKTHKKLATSVSPLVSVSPNKYASLVVEDVDTQCTMDWQTLLPPLFLPLLLYRLWGSQEVAQHQT